MKKGLEGGMMVVEVEVMGALGERGVLLMVVSERRPESSAGARKPGVDERLSCRCSRLEQNVQQQLVNREFCALRLEQRNR